MSTSGTETLSAAGKRDLMRRALMAFAGDVSEGDIEAVFTEDVTGTSPLLEVRSRAELAAVMAERVEGLSEPEAEAKFIDAPGDREVAEWHVTARHDGPVDLGDGVVAAPTGRRIELHGVTVAEFRDGRVCSFRNYFDQGSLVEQLLLPA